MGEIKAKSLLRDTVRQPGFSHVAALVIGGILTFADHFEMIKRITNLILSGSEITFIEFSPLIVILLKNIILVEILVWVYKYVSKENRIILAIKDTGEIVRSLVAIATYKGDKALIYSHNRLARVKCDSPVESLRNMLNSWGDKYNRNECSDLWHLLAHLYMREEFIDIQRNKIATNIEIYTQLLMLYFEYFTRKYGNKARIFIFTTLLPSQWYDKPNGVADEHFDHIRRYREGLEYFLKEQILKQINPELERYVAVVSNNDEALKKVYKVGSLNDLKEDINCKAKEENFRKYISGLHFRAEQAKYICVDGLLEMGPFTIGCRDLLAFGNMDEWLWVIKSDMLIEHPVMFLNFYDSASIEIEEISDTGATIDNIVRNIHRRQELQLSGKLLDLKNPEINDTSGYGG